MNDRGWSPQKFGVDLVRAAALVDPWGSVPGSGLQFSYSEPALVFSGLNTKLEAEVVVVRVEPRLNGIGSPYPK